MFSSKSLLVVAISAAVVFLGLATTSFADTINIDFGGATSVIYSNTAVAPDTGTHWNSGNGLENTKTKTFSNLLASDGTTAATGVSITITNVSSYDTTNDGHPATLKPTLMNDYCYSSLAGGGTGPTTFSINGLTSGGQYDLYLYSQNGGYGNGVTTFTIGEAAKVATNAGNISSFIAGTNYVLYSGLTATGGTISGTFSGTGGFNGFQLTSVPEPSTLVLFATGLIGLLAYAWRKRK
jgi:hypothetical protein